MEAEFTELERPLPLAEAVRRFGVEKLHPLDRRIWEEVPLIFSVGSLVTMVKNKSSKKEEEV